MPFANRDFKNRIIENISILEGTVPGYRLVSKFGYNTNVSSEFVDLWNGGTVKTYADVTGATATTVIASSASDQAGTTGANTLRIQGVDPNYDLITEDLTLTGATVTAAQQFLRVYRMQVLTAGSEGKNVGTVTAHIGSNKECVIPPDESQSQQALFTVPRNHCAYIESLSVYVDSTKLINTKLQVRDFGGVFQTRFNFAHSGWATENYFIPCLQKSDVRLQAKDSGAGIQVSAAFQIYLLDYGAIHYPDSEANVLGNF